MSNFNRFNSTLRRIKSKIDANNEASINEFFDHDKNTANFMYGPGDIFTITGKKIKIKGDDPECGVFFVPVDNPFAAVKVMFFSENSSSKITGIAPKTGYLHNRIEIRTRYTGSAMKFTRTPKVIATGLMLEVA